MLIVRMHETFTFYSKIYTITKSNPINQNQRYFTEGEQSNKDMVTLQNIVMIQKEVSSKKTKIIVQKKRLIRNILKLNKLYYQNQQLILKIVFGEI